MFLAFKLDGKPISRDHGNIRIILPHLYAWKSGKFLNKIEFGNKYIKGFWEKRGYHKIGNAFKEERFFYS